IIGTERHESRRIDNQLRGRAGRQGDPGSSRFYLSLEDDFLRLFAAPTLSGLMDRLGVKEDEPIESKMLSRSIESAQKKVEARNFDLRKQVLQYDDVMNLQREVIYKQRREILRKENLREDVMNMLLELVQESVVLHCPANMHPEEWDIDALLASLDEIFLPVGTLDAETLSGMNHEELSEVIFKAGEKIYQEKEEEFGEEAMRQLERMVTLQVVDSKWMEHLDAMDDLREGVNLRAYGQQDPLVEYKKEAYDMYQTMLASIREDVVRLLFHLQAQPAQLPQLQPQPQMLTMQDPTHMVQETPDTPPPANAPIDQPSPRPFQVIQGGQGRTAHTEANAVEQETDNDGHPILGRNDPCWCGSGKKYKLCHGASDQTHEPTHKEH
ncbi:MAG: SEC-C metal-binding domain-containing protein, partial [Firmicutes bacterium]|nr:SEC-C metal-binding domain-containing protein [Bacillota bacterium]